MKLIAYFQTKQKNKTTTPTAVLMVHKDLVALAVAQVLADLVVLVLVVLDLVDLETLATYSATFLAALLAVAHQEETVHQWHSKVQTFK